MVMDDIGCVVMASGLSLRYGRDKLLEMLGVREVILHVTGCLIEAGLKPLVVVRNPALKALVEGKGVGCVLHDGEKKSDTIHVGLLNLSPNLAGYLFMPADQPLVRPASVIRLIEGFAEHQDRAVRLGYGEAVGSPVIFPAAYREALLAYVGDRGGAEVLRREQVPCDVVQAECAWELWDVDTPEKMERVRKMYEKTRQC